MPYEWTLGDELLKVAKEELNEDPKRREADIQAIRDWINKQPHLKARTDDWFILRFLRGCKFSLERTKEKIDMYYTLRSALPEWFSNRDINIPKVREVLEMGNIVPLRGYDKKGRKVFLGKMTGFEQKSFSMPDYCKAMFIFMDVVMEEDEEGIITGYSYINDLHKLQTSLMLMFTPTISKKMMTMWQDGYPIRPKGLHYVNTPSAFESFFNIFKNFMKEKIRKRVHMHGNDFQSLYEHIPQEILPQEYGGNGGTLKELTDYWIKKVEERKDWLIEDEKYGVDESKRPGKPKTTDDLFGIEGSFRKLDVD